MEKIIQDQIDLAKAATEGFSKTLLTQPSAEDLARKKLMDWFSSRVGLTEEPVNKVVFNDWFYGKPVEGKSYAWCATFCCYGMAECGFPYPAMGWKHGFCSVPDYHKRMIQSGHMTSDPKCMDDVIFDWEKDGADDHIGKFVKWEKHGESFWTIEGNTSFDEKGHQSRGGAVAMRLRKIGSVSGFVSVRHLLKIGA